MIGKLLVWIWLWRRHLTSQGFISPIFGISILRIWNILAVISGFIATVNIHWWLDRNFIGACLGDLGRRVREGRATHLTAQWTVMSSVHQSVLRPQCSDCGGTFESSEVLFVFFFFDTFISSISYLFGCTRSSLQHVGSLVGACKLLVVPCGI